MPGSSAPTEMLARLRVVESPVPGLAGRELEVREVGVTIGRADDCDLPVPDPSMSRRHAELSPLPGGGLAVRDAGSANGLWVEGQKVGQATIVPGRRFALGGSTFEVLSLAGEVGAPAPAFAPVERTISIRDIAELLAQAGPPKSLEELGESYTVAANRPILLADPDAMYLVETGKVEIFTVGVELGQPVGARSHFLTIEPGQAFFGFDTDRYGLGAGFLAVGKAGSKLRRYSVERLQHLASLAEYRERIAQITARWLEGLARRLTSDMGVPPTAGVLLAAGEEVTLEVGKTVASSAQVVWLEMPAARFLFVGMAALSYEVEGVYFPLPAGSWLELLAGEQALTTTPRATSESIGDPRLWAGLEVFHRTLCECEFLNKKLAAVDEFNRLQRKAEQVEQAREVAYDAIGSVLAGASTWERQAQVSDLEPLVRAASLVAAAQGLKVRSQPDAREERSFEESVVAVATTSRFRTRRITLLDEWWKCDQGPLLGQREDTKAPVALLPVGSTAYELVDPATNERKRVDAVVAQSLAGFAYTFYRPFPDGPMTARSLLRFGFFGLGPEFRQVAMMGLGLGLLGTVTPMITGKIFDVAIPQAERGMLMQYAMGVFLVALGLSAFKITQNIAVLRVQGKMDYSVQAAVWDRLLDLPMNFFRKFSSGDLADRAQGVDQIRSIIAGAGVAAVLGSFSSLFNVVQMAGYSFKLAAIGIVLTLLYVGITSGANYVQLRYQREEAKRRGKITGLVLQLISGVAKLRVSGAENHAFRVWATDFADQRRVSFSVGRVRNVMAVVNAFYPVFCSMVLFFTMAKLYESAAETGEKFDLTTGDFLAFNTAFGMFMGAMQALGDASLSLLKIVPIFERLEPIVVATPEVDGSKVAPGRFKGEIEVGHVSFRYHPDSPLILKDVSLKIRPGEFIAFVGGSGSGKSTLLKVILGFERPEKGSVYYDGQDIATLDLRMLRSQLGVVLQESRLLPADIFRNIVGASSRTVSDAWDAAAKSGLADDIKAMPMGMHTYVPEGGGGFSGGQKQRLMIARAIVHQPKIIVLDEATSALDNRTQAIVTESMNKLQATRIVVAHRLSTIVDADRICYLDEGVLREVGTYQELMDKNGLFAALARRQMA